MQPMTPHKATNTSTNSVFFIMGWVMRAATLVHERLRPSIDKLSPAIDFVNHLPLSMNQPGHRIGGCFGKAALKTHALQTLRDHRASPNRAKRLECVRFIGAFHPARDGPRFMVAMHAKNARRLSMNRRVLPASCRQTDRRKALP